MEGILLQNEKICFVNEECIHNLEKDILYNYFGLSSNIKAYKYQHLLENYYVIFLQNSNQFNKLATAICSAYLFGGGKEIIEIKADVIIVKLNKYIITELTIEDVKKLKGMIRDAVRWFY